jgi:hypothetical protein
MPTSISALVKYLWIIRHRRIVKLNQSRHGMASAVASTVLCE